MLAGITVWVLAQPEPPGPVHLAVAHSGAEPIGGKWMLVLQAAEQLRLWTGREAPVDEMARAFDEAGRPT